MKFFQKSFFKNTAVLAIVVLTILGAASCKKNNNTNATNGIFVAGYEENTPGKNIAKYWKDGVAVSLTDGAFDAIADAIGNVGNDIYVSGYETNAAGKKMAKYWKNGSKFDLITDGSVDSRANSIFVNGSDVYIAGFYGNKAVYWKNGIITNLTDGTSPSAAYSIFVSGNDVYVAGNQKRGDQGSAIYWKNGTPNFLFTDNIYANKFSLADKIIVDNNDVYISTVDRFLNYNINSLKVFKNGVPFTVTKGDTYYSYTGIAKNGANIYVAYYDQWYGYVTNVNDTLHRSFVNFGLKGCYPNSVYFNGDDRYITGCQINNEITGTCIATYWTKDHVATSLTDGTKNAEATAIIAVK